MTELVKEAIAQAGKSSSGASGISVRAASSSSSPGINVRAASPSSSPGINVRAATPPAATPPAAAPPSRADVQRRASARPGLIDTSNTGRTSTAAPASPPSEPPRASIGDLFGAGGGGFGLPAFGGTGVFDDVLGGVEDVLGGGGVDVEIPIGDDGSIGIAIPPRGGFPTAPPPESAPPPPDDPPPPAPPAEGLIFGLDPVEAAIVVATTVATAAGTAIAAVVYAWS